MIIVNTDLKNYISGCYGGKNFSIPFTKEKYENIKGLEEHAKTAKTHEILKGIYLTMDDEVKVDYKSLMVASVEGLIYRKDTKTYHLAMGEGFSDLYLPEVLVNKVIDNYSRGIENTPIVNMFRRFIYNPKPTQERLDMLANYVTQTWFDAEEADRLMEEQGLSEEVAKVYATYNNIQITTEGYLRTYKVVDIINNEETRENSKSLPMRDERGRFIKGAKAEEAKKFLEDIDFTPAIYKCGDKFFSNGILGYKYKIGELAALPDWSYTSLVDESYHDKGLHNGGLSYIQGYLSGDRQLLDVFVCPSQIAKFTDHGLGEMTCKEFYIYGATYMDGNMKSLYHTSNYCKIQSKEIEAKLSEQAKESLKIRQQLGELRDSIVKAVSFAKTLEL
jgi:hypothetical protein